jgi:hypothetical protein
MERKTPTTSTVTPTDSLTDVQNVFRGSPKPVPKAQKSLGKQGGKCTKDSRTPTQESTTESASLKLVKNFFISIPGCKSLR